MNGAGGAGPENKHETFGPGFEEMIGNRVTDAAVVNADQIMLTAAGIAHVVAIQQHYRDVGVVEGRDNAAINDVFIRNQFKRSEEHAAHAVSNESLA